MALPLPPFESVLDRLRLDPTAPSPPGLAAALQLLPSVPVVDSTVVPHAVVPAIVVRWVVAPYTAPTVNGVAVSPAVFRAAAADESPLMSAGNTAPLTTRHDPAVTSALAVLQPAGIPRVSLALSSGVDAPLATVADDGDDDGVGCERTSNVAPEGKDGGAWGSTRSAVCVLDAAVLFRLYIDAERDTGTFVLPIPPTVVHDVVCVHVDNKPEFKEAATLQLAAAVACKLRATAVSFSGDADTFAVACFGVRYRGFHPPVVDMSGLRCLQSVLPDDVSSPWHGLHKIILPPLSPEGHTSNAHFGATRLNELVLGTPEQPSRLHHLGPNGFCFSQLARIDFRPCPVLQSVGSLTFQGSSALRIVCFRGLKQLLIFGNRPFLQCRRLALLDLRDAAVPTADSQVFDSAAVVLGSPESVDELQAAFPGLMRRDFKRKIPPDAVDSYPPGSLVCMRDATHYLRIALTEAQYGALPPSAPVSLGVECLCAHSTAHCDTKR